MEDIIEAINQLIEAVNQNSIPVWVTCVGNTICQALNRAKLLLPREDENLRNTLEVVHSKFKDICGKINSYYYEGYGISASENAWNVISLNGIARYDYNTLVRNSFLYDSYLKLCDTDRTKEIESLIEDLLSLFKYDKFDKFFEPYLRMSSMERNFDNVSNQ